MNPKPELGKDAVSLDHLRDADYSPYRFFTAEEWAKFMNDEQAKYKAANP